MIIDYRQLLLTGRFKQCALFMVEIPSKNKDAPNNKKLHLLTDYGFIRYTDPKCIFSKEEVLIHPDIKLLPGPDGVKCDDVLFAIEPLMNHDHYVYFCLDFDGNKYTPMFKEPYDISQILLSEKAHHKTLSKTKRKLNLEWDQQLIRNYISYRKMKHWQFEFFLCDLIGADRADLFHVYTEMNGMPFCSNLSFHSGLGFAITSYGKECIKYMFERGIILCDMGFNGLTMDMNAREIKIDSSLIHKIPRVTGDYERDIYNSLMNNYVLYKLGYYNNHPAPKFALFRILICFDRPDLLDHFIKTEASREAPIGATNIKYLDQINYYISSENNEIEYLDQLKKFFEIVDQPSLDVNWRNEYFMILSQNDEQVRLIKNKRYRIFQYLIDNDIFLHHLYFDECRRIGLIDELLQWGNLSEDKMMQDKLSKIVNDRLEKEKRKNPYIKIMEAIIFEDPRVVEHRISTILNESGRGININLKFLPTKFIRENFESETRIDLLTYILLSQNDELFDFLFENYVVDVHLSHLMISIENSSFRYWHQGDGMHDIFKLKVEYRLPLEYRNTIERVLGKLFLDKENYVSFLVKDVRQLILLFMITVPENPKKTIREIFEYYNPDCSYED